MSSLKDLYANAQSTIVWKLDDGIALVRHLQDDTREFGYHICIGGGVINKGFSEKDLDLYFLPLDNKNNEPNAEALKNFLDLKWGGSEDIIGEQYLKDSGSPCDYKIKFEKSGRRIDVFIVGRRTNANQL